MDKEKIATIFWISVLCVCVAVFSFLAGMFVEREGSFHEDGWVSVKTFNILSIPYQIGDGDQFDYVLVDKFIIEDGAVQADLEYGFLTVNETTGKIQFNIWR